MLEQLGAAVARRRRWVLAAWALLVLAGGLLGGRVFEELQEAPGSPDAESVVGLDLLRAAGARGGQMVVVVDGPPVTDEGTRRAVLAAAERVRQVPGVVSVLTAYDLEDPRLVADDGRASLVHVTTAPTEDVAVSNDRVGEVREVLAGAVPGARVQVGGELAVVRDDLATLEQDLVRGELIALPVLLVALLLVFRGLLPALLPLAGAVATAAGALLLLLAATRVVDVAGYAVDVVALLGLALAVDYSLLMVSRYREERGPGEQGTAALVRTVGTAGRTITYSALTVVASLVGLFAFDEPTFTSLALGGIATTLIALAAGLTLVPALLAAWGPRIRHDATARANDGGFGRLARAVQRRPVLVAALSATALLAAGVPFLGVEYGNGDSRVLPRSAESRQVADTLATRFPGSQASAVQVVAQLPHAHDSVRAYVDRLRDRPDVVSVRTTPLRGDTTLVEVVPHGTSQGDRAQALVRALREDRPAFPTHVTGSAAFLLDFSDRIADRLPAAIAVMVLATLVLLFLMTGSVLVPVKALVMNVLSLGAVFGALVWVFQDGHLSGLLGFDPYGAIEVWVPVVVFVFAFGLSMDYEVFLLSRIKEDYDATGDSDGAVVRGLQRSGRIITCAALLVMIVFAGFAAGQNLGIKQMGTALTLAVLVDATVVRCLLVPATMTLLGQANWWAPAPLRRLHQRFGLDETAAPGGTGPAPAPPTAALPDVSPGQAAAVARAVPGPRAGGQPSVPADGAARPWSSGPPDSTPEAAALSRPWAPPG